MQAALGIAPEPAPLLNHVHTVTVQQQDDADLAELPVLNQSDPAPALSSFESANSTLSKRPTFSSFDSSSWSIPKKSLRPNARSALAHIGQIGAAPASTKELSFVLPRIDGGRGAIGFLVLACITEALAFGLAGSYGVILDYYLQVPELADSPHSATILPLVGTLSGTVVYFGGPLMLAPLNRYPHRRKAIVWSGHALFSLGLGLASLAKTPWQLLLTQGALLGLGDTLAYFTVYTWLTEWFVRRRDLVSNLLLAASGLGGAITPLIVHKLLEMYGWRTTLRALAVGLFALKALITPFMHSRLHQVHNAAGHDPGVKVSAFDRIPHQSPIVWLCALAAVVQSTAEFTIGLYLASFATAVGVNSTHSTLLVTLFNLCACCGPLLVALGLRKFSPHWVAIAQTTTSSLFVLTLWGASSSYGVLVAFAMIIAISSSGYSGLFGSFAEYIHKDSSGNTLWGLLMATRGVGNLVVGPLGAALLKTELTGLRWRGYGVASPQAGHFGGIILFVGLAFASVTIVHLSVIFIARRRGSHEERPAEHESDLLDPVM
ncbi:uncharacterized protein L969DRAFT_174712 [Mixia osmundae IAM 14324]|uniref:Major facilitator superfamily (MFS) profile domain-containing protein n=1 Tax=Mixia osmundae (strain CBS 9802 / IAM 14324 / JCM 22182 / KY 12970) TaxID=764103 RepID=G7DTN0_MIXOS|nr:uncharacterized protein L969DRAFT_174712 [Mixia osmundae IAM 14324]KEI42789.1 hypothetical protein L969DRAFT_174712 [Mixia osmundae IAM 14324]GAA93877.1 hypothetical protein E5Q_00523 [Mixia osmundae IAM 14324]